MPAWEVNFLGHTLSLSVLIPFALPLGIVLGGAAAWPFFERWVTGDNAEHHINDRPRNAPARTGIGVAVVVFYGVLWAEGANDVIADHFHVPLYTVTWIARVLVIAGPVAAYVIARRICLGLQRKDAETLEHGVETGIVRQSPDGGFTEVLPPGQRRGAGGAVGGAGGPRPARGRMPAGSPRRAGAGLAARLRAGLNAAFTETAAAAADGNRGTRPAASTVPQTARASCRPARRTGKVPRAPGHGQVNDEHPAGQEISAAARPRRGKAHPVQRGGTRPA